MQLNQNECPMVNESESILLIVYSDIWYENTQYTIPFLFTTPDARRSCWSLFVYNCFGYDGKLLSSEQGTFTWQFYIVHGTFIFICFSLQGPCIIISHKCFPLSKRNYFFLIKIVKRRDIWIMHGKRSYTKWGQNSSTMYVRSHCPVGNTIKWMET